VQAPSNTKEGSHVPGLAGFVSGSGSVSPGLNFLMSSADGAEASSPSPATPSSWLSRASASSSNLPQNQHHHGRVPAIRTHALYRSKHWVAVLPTIGAIVLHCVGINFARCSNFSSSSRDHSTFRMLGSSHSDHRALHWLADFRARRDDTRCHWLSPYLETAALRISSSTFVQTPPLTTGMIGSQ
jgi:hypothetical protein